jgi:plastocyanin
MVVAAAALVFASRAAASWYLSLSATNDTVNCAKAGAGHFVVIHNSQADPAATTGTLCDTLTIINKDPKLRVMAFGPHDHHIAYDGVTEQTLAENQSMTITFNKLGTYTFHDHVDDSSIGTFTVLSR